MLVMALKIIPHPEHEQSEQSLFETPPLGDGSSGDARVLIQPEVQ
jgi:hypothetical protein